MQKTSLTLRRIISISLVVCILTPQGGAAEDDSSIWSQRQKNAQRLSLARATPALPSSLGDRILRGSALQPLKNSSQIGVLPKPQFKSESSLSSDLRVLAEALSRQPVTINRITDEGPARPIAVIIQDIHLNAEAQVNLTSAIGGLIETGKIKGVAAEGAFGPFNLKRFRAFPHPASVEKVVRAYLKTGRLAAGSAAALLCRRPEITFLGIDDQDLHAENVNAYLGALRQNKSINTALVQLQADQARDRSKLPADFAAFEQLRSDYSRSGFGMGMYLRKLSAFGIASGPDAKNFLDAYDLESKIDFNKADAERKTVLSRLITKMPEAELAALYDRSLAYRSGKMSFGAYYGSILRLCSTHNIKLESTPAFSSYLTYALKADAVSTDRLNGDVKKMEEAVEARLATTAELRRRIAISRLTDLSLKLSSYSLTPPDWNEYRERRKFLAAGPASLPPLFNDPYWKQAEAFYEVADHRSKTMIERLSSSMNGANWALVVGGFHSPDMMAQLREKKISTLLISPRLAAATTDAGSAYLSVFAREKTPLEKFFTSEKLTVCPAAVHVTHPPLRTELGVDMAADETFKQKAALPEETEITVEPVPGTENAARFTDQESGKTLVASEAADPRLGTPLREDGPTGVHLYDETTRPGILKRIGDWFRRQWVRIKNAFDRHSFEMKPLDEFTRLMFFREGDQTWFDLSHLVGFVNSHVETLPVDQQAAAARDMMSPKGLYERMENVSSLIAPYNIKEHADIQAATRLQAPIELISNAMDAVDPWISRFGFGFYQALGSLSDDRPDERVIFTGVTPDGRRIGLLFRKLNGALQARPVTEQEWLENEANGQPGAYPNRQATRVRIKRNLDPVQQNEILAFVRERVQGSRRMRIYINGTLVNPLSGFVSLPSGTAETDYDNDAAVHITVNENGVVIENPGTIDEQVLFLKLIYPRRGRENGLTRAEKMRRKAAAAPAGAAPRNVSDVQISADLAPDASNKTCRLVFQVAGMGVEPIVIEGFGLPRELIINMPPEISLNASRAAILIDREGVFAGAMQQIIQQILQIKDTEQMAQVANAIMVYLEKLQNRTKWTRNPLVERMQEQLSVQLRREVRNRIKREGNIAVFPALPAFWGMVPENPTHRRIYLYAGPLQETNEAIEAEPDVFIKPTEGHYYLFDYAEGPVPGARPVEDFSSRYGMRLVHVDYDPGVPHPTFFRAGRIIYIDRKYYEWAKGDPWRQAHLNWWMTYQTNYPAPIDGLEIQKREDLDEDRPYLGWWGPRDKEEGDVEGEKPAQKAVEVSFDAEALPFLNKEELTEPPATELTSEQPASVAAPETKEVPLAPAQTSLAAEEKKAVEKAPEKPKEKPFHERVQTAFGQALHDFGAKLGLSETRAWLSWFWVQVQKNGGGAAGLKEAEKNFRAWLSWSAQQFPLSLTGAVSLRNVGAINPASAIALPDGRLCFLGPQNVLWLETAPGRRRWVKVNAAHSLRPNVRQLPDGRTIFETEDNPSAGKRPRITVWLESKKGSNRFSPLFSEQTFIVNQNETREVLIDNDGRVVFWTPGSVDKTGQEDLAEKDSNSNRVFRETAPGSGQFERLSIQGAHSISNFFILPDGRIQIQGTHAGPNLTYPFAIFRETSAGSGQFQLFTTETDEDTLAAAPAQGTWNLVENPEEEERRAAKRRQEEERLAEKRRQEEEAAKPKVRTYIDPLLISRETREKETIFRYILNTFRSDSFIKLNKKTRVLNESTLPDGTRVSISIEYDLSQVSLVLTTVSREGVEKKAISDLPSGLLEQSFKDASVLGEMHDGRMIINVRIVAFRDEVNVSLVGPGKNSGSEKLTIIRFRKETDKFQRMTAKPVPATDQDGETFLKIGADQWYEETPGSGVFILGKPAAPPTVLFRANLPSRIGLTVTAEGQLKKPNGADPLGIIRRLTVVVEGSQPKTIKIEPPLRAQIVGVAQAGFSPDGRIAVVFMVQEGNEIRLLPCLEESVGGELVPLRLENGNPLKLQPNSTFSKDQKNRLTFSVPGNESEAYVLVSSLSNVVKLSDDPELAPSTTILKTALEDGRMVEVIARGNISPDGLSALANLKGLIISVEDSPGNGTFRPLLVKLPVSLLGKIVSVSRIFIGPDGRMGAVLVLEGRNAQILCVQKNKDDDKLEVVEQGYSGVTDFIGRGALTSASFGNILIDKNGAINLVVRDNANHPIVYRETKPGSNQFVLVSNTLWTSDVDLQVMADGRLLVSEKGTNPRPQSAPNGDPDGGIPNSSEKGSMWAPGNHTVYGEPGKSMATLDGLVDVGLPPTLSEPEQELVRDYLSRHQAFFAEPSNSAYLRRFAAGLARLGSLGVARLDVLAFLEADEITGLTPEMWERVQSFCSNRAFPEIIEALRFFEIVAPAVGSDNARLNLFAERWFDLLQSDEEMARAFMRVLEEENGWMWLLPSTNLSQAPPAWRDLLSFFRDPEAQSLPNERPAAAVDVFSGQGEPADSMNEPFPLAQLLSALPAARGREGRKPIGSRLFDTVLNKAKDLWGVIAGGVLRLVHVRDTVNAVDDVNLIAAQEEGVRRTVLSQSDGYAVWIRELVQNARDAIRTALKRGRKILAGIKVHAWFEPAAEGGFNRVTRFEDQVGMDLRKIVEVYFPIDVSDKKPGSGTTGKIGQGNYSVWLDGTTRVRLRTGVGDGFSYLVELEAERDADGRLLRINVVRFEEYADKFTGSVIEHIRHYPAKTTSRFLEGALLRLALYRFVGDTEGAREKPDQRITLDFQDEPVRENVNVLSRLKFPDLGEAQFGVTDTIPHQTADGLDIRPVDDKFWEGVPLVIQRVLRHLNLTVRWPPETPLTEPRDDIALTKLNPTEWNNLRIGLLLMAAVELLQQKGIWIPDLPRDALDNNRRASPEIEMAADDLNRGVFSGFDLASLVSSQDNLYALICRLQPQSSRISLVELSSRIRERVDRDENNLDDLIAAAPGLGSQIRQQHARLLNRKREAEQMRVRREREKKQAEEKGELPPPVSKTRPLSPSEFPRLYRFFESFRTAVEIPGASVKGMVDELIGARALVYDLRPQEIFLNERYAKEVETYLTDIAEGKIKGEKAIRVVLRRILDIFVHENVHSWEGVLFGGSSHSSHGREGVGKDSFPARMARGILNAAERRWDMAGAIKGGSLSSAQTNQPYSFGDALKAVGLAALLGSASISIVFAGLSLLFTFPLAGVPLLIFGTPAVFFTVLTGVTHASLALRIRRAVNAGALGRPLSNDQTLRLEKIISNLRQSNPGLRVVTLRMDRPSDLSQLAGHAYEPAWVATDAQGNKTLVINASLILALDDRAGVQERIISSILNDHEDFHLQGYGELMAFAAQGVKSLRYYSQALSGFVSGLLSPLARLRSRLTLKLRKNFQSPAELGLEIGKLFNEARDGRRSRQEVWEALIQYMDPTLSPLGMDSDTASEPAFAFLSQDDQRILLALRNFVLSGRFENAEKWAAADSAFFSLAALRPSSGINTRSPQADEAPQAAGKQVAVGWITNTNPDTQASDLIRPYLDVKAGRMRFGREVVLIAPNEWVASRLRRQWSRVAGVTVLTDRSLNVSDLIELLMRSKSGEKGFWETDDFDWRFLVPRGYPLPSGFFDLRQSKLSMLQRIRLERRITVSLILDALTIKDMSAIKAREWQAFREALISA